MFYSFSKNRQTIRNHFGQVVGLECGLVLSSRGCRFNINTSICLSLACCSDIWTLGVPLPWSATLVLILVSSISASVSVHLPVCLSTASCDLWRHHAGRIYARHGSRRIAAVGVWPVAAHKRLFPRSLLLASTARRRLWEAGTEQDGRWRRNGATAAVRTSYGWVPWRRWRQGGN